MKPRRLLIFVGLAVGAVGMVLVAALGVAFYSARAVALQGGPEVVIRNPAHGSQVPLGRTTQVQAIASEPDGVMRVELWVDGQLLEVGESSLPRGSTPLPLLADWQPLGLGPHTLVVRAYDAQRRSGQATAVVQAVEGAAPAAYILGEGGADGVPSEVLEAVAAEHPELEEALQSGEVGLNPAPPDTDESAWRPPEDEGPEPLEGEGPPNPFPGEEMPGLLQRILGVSTGTFELPASWLEVEALSLEVDKEYDGVYCYVALGGLGAERLPADGTIPTEGGRTWDIAALMGGENRRQVPIPDGDAPLDVVVSCLGINESGGTAVSFDLGTLRTSHLSTDWDGRRLDHWVIGSAGWFRLAYRISYAGLEGEEVLPFPAPTGLSKHCFENEFLNTIFCTLSWSYREDHLGEISGYIIVRNNDFYMDLPLGVPAADMRELPLSEGGGVPACGESFEYQVMAYQGDLIAGPRSAPSNPLVLEGETCANRGVTVTFETLNTVCLTGDCLEDPYVVWGSWMPPEGPLDPVGCDRGRGCEGGEYYATLWANGHEIHLGGMNDMGIVYPWQCGGIYSIADMYTFGEDNPLHFDVAPYESLDIRMQVYDNDWATGDDLQCSGGALLTPDDLRAVASMPGRTRSFTRAFNQAGGGACYLVFSVEVDPVFTPLEHEPYQPMGEE